MLLPPPTVPFRSACSFLMSTYYLGGMVSGLVHMQRNGTLSALRSQLAGLGWEELGCVQDKYPKNS